MKIKILLFLALATPLLAQNFWDFDPPEDDYEGAELDLKALFGQDAITAEDALTLDGDSFVKASTGEKVRIWGVNVNADSNTEAAAKFYAKRGVNGVRYHDSKALVDKDSPTYLPVGNQIMDRLHKNIASYSSEGIYTFLSETFFPLSLPINPLWEIDGYTSDYQSSGGQMRPFFVFWFDQDLKSAYKGWLKQMVERENPYNGLTIAEDPAVGAIELVNEDNLFFWTFTPDNVPAVQWEKVEAAMYDFVVDKYGSYDAALAVWGDLGSRFNADEPENGRLHVLPAGSTNIGNLRGYTPDQLKRVADQIEFLATTQRNWFAEMKQVLRDNGYDGPVIATNWKTSDGGAATDRSYLQDIEYWTYSAAGVLDNHSYFSPVLSEAQAGGSVSSGERYYAPPAVLEPRRLSSAVKQVEGHPSIVSEFTWTSPNNYRSEATTVISAHGSLNDVDALFWFAASGEGWDLSAGLSRWPVSIPSKAGLFPAAALAYRRGDIDPSPVLVREGRTMESFRKADHSLIKSLQGWDITRDPEEFNFNPGTGEGTIDALAILAGKVEMAFNTDADYTHPDLDSLWDNEAGFVRSLSSELETNFAEGKMIINTPLTQGMAGFLDDAGTAALDAVRIRGRNQFGSILVTSLDGHPLNQSSRILVQSGTPDRLTGWETRPWFTTLGGVAVEGSEVIDVGTQPWQLENTDGRVTFLITDRQPVRAVSLNINLEVQNEELILAGGSGVNYTLPENAMYSIVEFEEPENYTPVVASKTAPNAMLGKPYEAKLRGLSGDGELTWSATSGLPAGLSLSSEGILSGSPRQSGDFSIEVRVEDEDGDPATGSVRMYVLGISDFGENLWAGLDSNEGWKEPEPDWRRIHDEHFPFVYTELLGWLYFADQESALDHKMYHLYMMSEGEWISLPEPGWGAGYFDYADDRWEGSWVFTDD